MTTAAKHSTAFRLGRALGSLARFGMHDRNPTLRWVRRLVIATVIVLVLASTINWILSVLLTAFSLVLCLYALSKVEFCNAELFSEREEAPYDRDVFERPLDSYGRSVK